MSERTITEIKKLLDQAMILGKEEFGESFSTRYGCPVVDEWGNRCSVTSEPPSEFKKFCPQHGNEIVGYQSTEYDEQPWQEAFNRYFYHGNFEEQA